VKVPSNQILVGSLVTHSKSGRKGIVIKTDREWCLVCHDDDCESCWYLTSHLEWTDANKTQRRRGRGQVAISPCLAHRQGI
jgi:hypothetical protein